MPTFNNVNINVQFNDNLDDSPNIISGEEIKTLFAKIHKRFSEMNNGAYQDIADQFYPTGVDSAKLITGAVLSSALSQLPEPMVFKGSLGTGGTITTLPAASSANEGYVYKVITDGTYASTAAKVGDTFISDGTVWVLIPSGDEPSGTVTSVGVSAGTGISVSGSPITSSGTITVSHSDTSSQASVTNTGHTYIQSVGVDGFGHVTSISSATGVDPTTVSENRSALTRLVDGKCKNLLSVQSATNFNNTWAEVPVNLSAGKYVISFTSLTSTDTDSSVCRIVFYDASYNITTKDGKYLFLNRGNNVYLEFELESTTTSFRLIPADTVNPNSYGDTVTYVGGMICTLDDWNISNGHIDYFPIGSDTLYSTGTLDDRSSEILAKLNTYGHCKLTDGVYYVSGVDMPDGTMLEGNGKNTIIRLLDTVNSGYCVKIMVNNTVQNICFSGGTEAPANVNTDGASLGTRHGIYLIANANGSGTGTKTSCTNIVTDCNFENFDGSGYYASNTGGSLDNGVILTDCRFRDCMVGINAAYYTEYSKFANCVITSCNVACVNNGGNNVFIGCTFHGVKGMVIDNTSGTNTNIAHGSAVACTFNHINKVNNPSAGGGGKAIEVKSASSGFIFDTCQIWYGVVDISSSRAMHFSDCLFGGDFGSSPAVVTVTGTYGAYFDGCIFYTDPVLNVNAQTIFDNCYSYATGYPVNPNPDPVLVNLVDSGAKNIMPVASGANMGNGYFQQVMTIPAGDYVVYFGNYKTSNSETECRIGFYNNSNNPVASYKYINVGSAHSVDNAYVEVTLNSPCSYFRFFTAKTAGSSSGSDTLSFSDCMICKKSDWLISKKYVPYAPSNADLYALIKSYHPS
jgi:hypothetical protein